MGNKRWVHRVLKDKEVDDYIAKYRESLRIEVYDGWPHLQMLIKGESENYFKTLGRTRKSIFDRHETLPMEAQPGYVNVYWHKFRIKQTDYPMTSDSTKQEKICDLKGKKYNVSNVKK